MKREVRLPTKGYDLLRRQVQARRGSPTNRTSPDEGPSADLADAAAEEGALKRVDVPSPSARAEEAPTREGAAEPAKSGASDPAAKPCRGPTREAVQTRPSENPAPSSRPVGTGRVTLKVNLTAPAAGVFPFYDRVIETMPPRRAVPLLLAKAFEELEASAIRGDAILLEEYKPERNGERISTSRTMDAATFETLRASVDPHDLMRPSSLGAALATTALSLYLRRHG